MYPQVFGKYVLERELARGGMARVVLATLKGAGGFEKKLVVKQIRDELAWDDNFVKRFVDEAKTTVALSHPNIVPVYELGVELGTYYLAMEYVEGVSTADLLKGAARDGKTPLSPEEGAYVGVEICRALDYAHRRMKVVHRDITPRNVMVDEEGQVRVIDFGIAAPASVGGTEVFGSPGHMPPEQIEGKELTPATDVFAVAVLLLELWSGKAPFRRRDPDESEAAMRTTRPKPSEMNIRLLPLDDMFARALALDPAERPQEADELGRALRKFLSGFDTHDVARELGDRVRDLRVKPLVPSNTKRAGLERPASKPSAATIRTRTFAAREVVKEWVPGSGEPRPPSASAEEEPTEGTRRMPVSEPPPSVDTMATRPLETARRDLARAVRPARGRAGMMALAAAVAVVTAGGLLLARQLIVPSPAPSSTTSGLATQTQTGPATGHSSGLAAPTVPAPPSSATGDNVPKSGMATPGTPVDAGLPAAARAKLALLGDPGTLVAVDGAPRGGCPTEVALAAGSHDVRFTFPATGESRGQNITLKAGEHATMRAEFTGASPTLSVWRR